jgi:dipeptidyl-peptidase-3
MKNFTVALVCILISFQLAAQSTDYSNYQNAPGDGDFVWKVDQFADISVIKYQLPNWDNLSLDQQKLVYYLTEAGYAGRDIIYDQNYKHNLAIRHALESIISNFTGPRSGTEWDAFMVYTKRVWFSNGIHHHYSMDKIQPGFSRDYFRYLMLESNTWVDPDIQDAIFNPAIAPKKVSLDSDKDLLLSSATNFYGEDVTQAEAEAFYEKMIDKKDPKPISYGLNSRLVRSPSGLVEQVYSINGLYGEAIEHIVYWLEKAVEVAENKAQADALRLLIDYYKTGDLKTWDAYNIAWTEATAGDIDYINSFIEVYNDPLGYRGSFESIVQINDFEASARMKVMADNAQWFEDRSPIMDSHKKKNVVGVSYKVVNVAGESGDASPSTPIGVNLPNANWIRADHGSKSVSLGNIVEAYSNAGSSGVLEEFCYNEAELKSAKEYGQLAGKLHTAMHEVIGHASGQINPGIGTPKETLKNYANALEEGRADLVALYFIYDPKLIELGLMPNMEVAKAEYDGYIRNGLMVQLRRLEPGANVEESHMRNRQMIAKWCYEKGKKDNVIEMKVVNGKTYFTINNYEKLRVLFGELLKEIQRIKSEGDYAAGKALVENYGVKVDQKIHQEVLKRTAALEGTAYSGFVNPRILPVLDASGEITGFTIEYADSFVRQMMDYGRRYSHLPVQN